MLTYALALAGTNTPTPAELAAALAEMYPGGTAPAVAELLAGGWLAPAISDRTRLRLPPFPLAEIAARLAAGKAPAAAPALPISAPEPLASGWLILDF